MSLPKNQYSSLGLEVAVHVVVGLVPLVSQLGSRTPNKCRCLASQHNISEESEGGRGGVFLVK